MDANSAKNPRPPFDHAFAANLIGKHVLFGLTFVDVQGTPLRQRQYHGVIESADEQRGFAIRLNGVHDGCVRVLPPDTRAFQAAKPGEYRLRSTGEVIINPDYLSQWTFREGPRDGGKSSADSWAALDEIE